MLHDTIKCAESFEVELKEPKPPDFRTANGLTHIPHDNGKEGCSCLAGFGRLLIWATRNNGH
jgi:hypothetical protein